MKNIFLSQPSDRNQLFMDFISNLVGHQSNETAVGSWKQAVENECEELSIKVDILGQAPPQNVLLNMKNMRVGQKDYT